MLEHDDIWRAIDRLATRNDMTTAIMAEKASLSGTTFNPSKRVDRKTGRLRWPSTESLAKVLNQNRTSLAEFAGLTQSANPMPLRLGRRPLDTLTADRFGKDGKPSRRGWRKIGFPNGGDPEAFALEITDTSWEPAFFPGETLVICPNQQIRPKDRVVMLGVDGKFTLREMVQSTRQVTKVRELTGRRIVRTFATSDFVWVYRIGWSQY